jgi:hypothetical protein
VAPSPLTSEWLYELELTGARFGALSRRGLGLKAHHHRMYLAADLRLALLQSRPLGKLVTARSAPAESELPLEGLKEAT